MVFCRGVPDDFGNQGMINICFLEESYAVRWSVNCIWTAGLIRILTLVSLQ
jgi:hypothetical protein